MLPCHLITNVMNLKLLYQQTTARAQISLSLIKYHTTATEPTEFTGHCLVLSLCVSCARDWVWPGSMFKSQYSKPFCLMHIILPETEFVKRKGTAIFGGFYLLLDSWNSNKCSNCCIGNVSCWVNTGWVNTVWVLLLVCRGL